MWWGVAAVPAECAAAVREGDAPGAKVQAACSDTQVTPQSPQDWYHAGKGQSPHWPGQCRGVPRALGQAARTWGGGRAGFVFFEGGAVMRGGGEPRLAPPPGPVVLLPCPPRLALPCFARSVRSSHLCQSRRTAALCVSPPIPRHQCSCDPLLAALLHCYHCHIIICCLALPLGFLFPSPSYSSSSSSRTDSLCHVNCSIG